MQRLQWSIAPSDKVEPHPVQRPLHWYAGGTRFSAGVYSTDLKGAAPMVRVLTKLRHKNVHVLA